jgi:hypothetical protein
MMIFFIFEEKFLVLNLTNLATLYLSQPFQNKIYPTVATVPKQIIPHCRNSSKTKYTPLSQQFQNKIYLTVVTVPKQNIPHCPNSSKTKYTTLS